MFAYCENDPVNRSDPNGDFHILVGAFIGAATSYIGARICGESPKKALEEAAWGALSGALSAAIPGAGAAIDVVISAGQSIFTDIKEGQSAGTVVLDAVVSAGLSSFSGVADDFISTKAATRQFKKAIGSVPKLLKGNHPKVKAFAKKEVRTFLRRAGKSVLSTVGWNTGTSAATTKVKKVIKSTV